MVCKWVGFCLGKGKDEGEEEGEGEGKRRGRVRGFGVWGERDSSGR